MGACLRESPKKKAFKDHVIHNPATRPLPKGKNVRGGMPHNLSLQIKKEIHAQNYRYSISETTTYG
jgi:hypothetical protein